MEQAYLSTCPICATKLSPDALNGTDSEQMQCKACNYVQHIKSREKVIEICKTLLEHCYGRGIDTFTIKGHELSALETMRGDSLLPLIIDKCNRLVKGKLSLPFITVNDNTGLLKLRVIYTENESNTEPSFYIKTLISIIDSLIDQTHKFRPELSSNIIDIGLLIETPKQKPIKTGDSTDKITNTPKKEAKTCQIIKTMTENRSEDAKFGQLKEMKKNGARLLTSPYHLEFKETLNKEFPWFERTTEVLTRELMARSIGCGTFKLPPIILVGKPGIGKTAYCTRLAEICNVPFNFLGLGGSTSNLILAGTERGWNTARPSLALQTIMDHDAANPLILLDEIDKAGGSERNGHPHHTLLSLVEPSSAKYWYDPFLMGHTDLSHISWIATANTITHLPSTLLSRFRVINVESPAIDDYAAIVWRTRNKFCESYGLDTSWVPEFTDHEWNWLTKYFKSPRIAKRATEELLKYLITNPPERMMN